jgi:serine/threonine-protein kinase
MTPERHARIQEIFEAAIELPDHQRRAFIDGECGGDADLRHRVARLIEAADTTVTLDIATEEHARLAVKECPRCSRCFDTPITNCPDDGTELDACFPGPLLIGGRYRIEKRLGSGGMGSVFLAQHIGLEKYFALKLINIDGPIPVAYRARFENEALALGRLKHPNIVDVTDFGIDDRDGGLPYLVMEYVEGGTLREYTREGKTLPFHKILPLLREVAAGVDAAHAREIVHGDLKPANVLTGSAHVKIVDFGLARLPSANSERASSGTIRGTPGYMAPELFRGEEASKASDRFAFGALAYELLTGEAPFGRQILEVRENQARAPAAPSESNAALPHEIDAPILALLDPDPDRRPGSATDAVSALEFAWIAAEQRKWRAREILPRIGIAAAAAAAAALLASWSAGSALVKAVEERTIDWRFAMLPTHLPDQRLLIVSVDDETLARNSRPLASMDADFARMIDRLFGAGAQAVAVDILLPDWSQSQQFGKAILTHADRIALAEFSTPAGVTGPECVGPLTSAILGPDRYKALFGFVNLDPDEDRRIRRVQLSFVDTSGGPARSFARRAVEAAGFAHRSAPAVWIDYSVRARDVPAMGWTAAESELDRNTRSFAGKLVILGANFAGSGDLDRIPDESAKQLVPRVVVQALIANTILENFQVSQAPLFRSMLPIAAGSFAVIWLALMLPHRPLWSHAAASGILLGWLAFGFLIFPTKLTLVYVVAPEICVILSAIAAWQIPSRLGSYPEAVP